MNLFCAQAGLPALLLVAAFSLTGCGDTRKTSGQVIAVVGKDEITANQLDLLTREAKAGQTAATALEQLIDRQLTARSALDAGMDRQPEILLRLENARLEVLSSAYAESVARKLTPPSSEDVAKFYKDNPGLFQQRKLYRLREVLVPADAKLQEEISARMSRNEALNALLAWLRDGGRQIRERALALPTDQLPIDLADKFAKAKLGDVIALKRPDGYVIYEIQAEQSAPVPWAEASNGIKAHLIKVRSADALKAEVQRLREATKIEKNALPAEDAK